MKREALTVVEGTDARRLPAARSAGKTGAAPAPANEPTVEVDGALAQPLAGQAVITIEEINGRLSELADLNQILTARCAQFRGEIAKKDAEIARLTKELVAARQQLEAKPSVLKRK